MTGKDSFMDYKLKAVVLAAGKGTRLQTEGVMLPKVMRLANGKPLLEYVLKALAFIAEKNTILVVGYKKEDVLAHFSNYPFAVQDEQLGTGHAVLSAEEHLKGFDGSVLICCGDMPLLNQQTYKALADVHFKARNACTILTGTSDVALPYGRIVRDENGDFVQLVEEKDCTPEQLKIRELNSGVYIFEAAKLLPALSKLKNNNAQGEYYLTDVPVILRGEGEKIGICKRELGSQLIGVNTVEQLAHVEQLLRKREDRYNVETT